MLSPCDPSRRKHEITNRTCRRFLEVTRYQRRNPEYLLGHWLNSVPRPCQEDQSVVYVDLDDAHFADLRLPTEEEWQFALEQLGSRPDGVQFWNWTQSKHSDRRTRFCILKGATDFVAVGSECYTDGGTRAPAFVVKFQLTLPEPSTCATICFRSAVNLEEVP